MIFAILAGAAMLYLYGLPTGFSNETKKNQYRIPDRRGFNIFMNEEIFERARQGKYASETRLPFQGNEHTHEILSTDWLLNKNSDYPEAYQRNLLAVSRIKNPEWLMDNRLSNKSAVSAAPLQLIENNLQNLSNWSSYSSVKDVRERKE